jgi:hypothetical protein
MADRLVRYRVDGGIARIELDHPPANTVDKRKAAFKGR